MDGSHADRYDMRRALLLVHFEGAALGDAEHIARRIHGKPSPYLDAILRSETLHPRDGVALRDAIAFTIRCRREHKLRQPPSPPLPAEGAYTHERNLDGRTRIYTTAWVWQVIGLLSRLSRAEHSVVDLPRADEWLKFPGHAVMDSRPRHFSDVLRDIAVCRPQPGIAHTDLPDMPRIVGIDYGLNDFGHFNPPQWPTRRLPPLPRSVGRCRCTLDADRDRIHADIMARPTDCQPIPAVVLTRNEALRLGLKDGDVEDGKLVVVSKPIPGDRQRPAAVVGRRELLDSALDLDERRMRPLLG